MGISSPQWLQGNRPMHAHAKGHVAQSEFIAIAQIVFGKRAAGQFVLLPLPDFCLIDESAISAAQIADADTSGGLTSSRQWCRGNLAVLRMLRLVRARIASADHNRPPAQGCTSSGLRRRIRGQLVAPS